MRQIMLETENTQEQLKQKFMKKSFLLFSTKFCECVFIGFPILIDFIYKVKIRIILRLLRQLRQMIFRVNELHTCTPRVYIVSTMLVLIRL